MIGVRFAQFSFLGVLEGSSSLTRQHHQIRHSDGSNCQTVYQRDVRSQLGGSPKLVKLQFFCA